MCLIYVAMEARKDFTLKSRQSALAPRTYPVSVEVVIVFAFQKRGKRSHKPYKPDGWQQCLVADRQVTGLSVLWHV